MTADPDRENPELLHQHIKKGRMGDKALAQKPGAPAPVEDEGHADKMIKDDRRRRGNEPDAEETYRQNQQRPK